MFTRQSTKTYVCEATMKQYAIKLRLAVDDWIFITEDNGGNCWDLVPALFDTKEKAQSHLESMFKDRTNIYVKVVEYNGTESMVSNN